MTGNLPRAAPFAFGINAFTFLNEVVGCINVPDHRIVIFPGSTTQRNIVAEHALSSGVAVWAWAEDKVKALIINGNVVHHHQLARVEVVGETIEMVTHGDTVADFMGHRLAFAAELEAIAGIVAGNGVQSPRRSHHPQSC